MRSVEQGTSREGYTVHPVPFEEWADVDTLVHRTAVTSGDFDYILRPLCPDCGSELEPEYEEVEEGASLLTSLACDECRLLWHLAPEDEDEPFT